MEVADSELKPLYQWVDEIPLSRPKRNIARDFADGVLVAEVIAHFYPRLIELHNYSSANAMTQKMYNWQTLNQRVLRKLGSQIPLQDVQDCCNNKAGAIERVLKLCKYKMAEFQSKHGVKGPGPDAGAKTDKTSAANAVSRGAQASENQRAAGGLRARARAGEGGHGAHRVSERRARGDDPRGEDEGVCAGAGQGHQGLRRGGPGDGDGHRRVASEQRRQQREDRQTPRRDDRGGRQDVPAAAAADARGEDEDGDTRGGAQAQGRRHRGAQGDERHPGDKVAEAGAARPPEGCEDPDAADQAAGADGGNLVVAAPPPPPSSSGGSSQRGVDRGRGAPNPCDGVPDSVCKKTRDKNPKQSVGFGIPIAREKAGKNCNRPKKHVRPVFFRTAPGNTHAAALASPQRSRASPFLDDERQSHGHSPARLRPEPPDSLGGATADAGIAIGARDGAGDEGSQGNGEGRGQTAVTMGAVGNASPRRGQPPHGGGLRHRLPHGGVDDHPAQQARALGHAVPLPDRARLPRRALRLGRSVILVHTGAISLEKHKDITLSSWLKNVLLIGFFTGVTLATGNMAYFYLSLSFLQMAKALSPVALFFVLTITGLDRFHMSVFISVMVIVFGAAVAAYAEVHFTWIGIGLVVTAESFEALKSAAFQFLLANKSFSMWEGMYFVSPASSSSSSSAASPSTPWNFRMMIEEDAWGQMKKHPLIFIACGTLGFAVNYCSLGVIKNAGSLTLKVLAQMKSILIFFCGGIAIYSDVVSLQTALGYATSIVGFGFFTTTRRSRRRRRTISCGGGGWREGWRGGGLRLDQKVKGCSPSPSPGACAMRRRGGASMAIPEIYTVAHLFLDNTEYLTHDATTALERRGGVRQQLFPRDTRSGRVGSTVGESRERDPFSPNRGHFGDALCPGRQPAAMSNFGDKAATLVQDISQSEKGTIPPYNDELVRAVVDESNEHHRSILRLIGDIQEQGTSLDAAAPEDAAAILVHHQAVLRNKRALLVYLNERADRVRALRWEVGTALPEDLGESLSHSERGYFQQYSALVNRYQGRRGVWGSTSRSDPTLPKEHKVQVRVLQERGELVTRDGTVDLAKNTVHLLWRDEAQPLITEGVVEMVV